MKVATFFSGIGAPEEALDNLGIEYELVHWCEIDKYAIKSYKAIHNPKVDNLGDITKVDKTKLSYFDLLVAGFPCQDISLAGKQQGFSEGSGTRSSLVWTTLEIIDYVKPKYVLLENVKNLASEQFTQDREKLFKRLENSGYICYDKVLNAKDYGIPQNRERYFIVGIRKDIDKGFIFPSPKTLKLRLKDMLEDEVDEKYYLSDKMMKYISKSGTENFANNDSRINLDIARPLTTDQNKRAGTTNYISEDLPENLDLKRCIQIGELDIKGNEQIRRIYSDKGLSPTLTNMQGGNRQPKVLIKGNVNPSGKGINGNVISSEGLCNTLTTNKGEGQKILTNETICLNSKVNGKQPSTQDRIYDSNGVSTAITTSYMPSITNNLRIRKLTPLECYRLMGFNDEDYYKAKYSQDYLKVMDIMNSNWSLEKKLEFVKGYKEGVSNTQIYKQAGNSIVVQVLEAILKNLFDDTPQSLFAFEF